MPARRGSVFTRDGLINIRNAAYAEDLEPLDPGCGCTACAGFTRAYARHLILAGEMVGARLCSIHNLHFYLEMLSGARRAIEAGTFAAFHRKFLERFPRSPKAVGERAKKE